MRSSKNDIFISKGEAHMMANLLQDPQLKKFFYQNAFREMLEFWRRQEGVK